MDDIAVVLLAGGEARRFPRKLEQPIGGEPMIVRSYRSVYATNWPVHVAARGSFPREIDARLDAPMLVDRRPIGGPLSALVGACTHIRARRIAALAADQPDVDASLLQFLASAWESGDEAVVPRHGAGIEPLAAIYDRRAVLREAFGLRRRERNAMHDLVECLATRFVQMSARPFRNVNHPGDLAAAAGP